MKTKVFVLTLTFAAVASAQTNLGGYFSRGIFGRGVGDIGSRGGQQADLRFFLGLEGVADSSYQKATTDSAGNLINPGFLTGVRLTGGVYGVHSWKRAQLGLDYRGELRHYPSNANFDGSSNSLMLGYTFHPTSRVTLDLRQGVSAMNQSFSNYYAGTVDPADPAISSLLDTRFYGLNSQASVTYLLDARTSVTVGGGGRYQYRRTPTVFETIGFSTSGSFLRRVTMHTSVGVDYAFMHDRARNDTFSSAIHTIQGRYIVEIGPAWTLDFSGGVYIADVDLQSYQLDPFLSSIFGTPAFVLRPVNTRRTNPSGAVTISRRFKRSLASLSASRSAVGGAATYFTAQADSISALYTHTATRRWSFNINAMYSANRAIGSSYGNYSVLGGGTGVTYELLPSLHFVANVYVRHLNVAQTGYARNPSQVSAGLTFSPGSIPLSFR